MVLTANPVQNAVLSQNTLCLVGPKDSAPVKKGAPLVQADGKATLGGLMIVIPEQNAVPNTAPKAIVVVPKTLEFVQKPPGDNAQQAKTDC